MSKQSETRTQEEIHRQSAVVVCGFNVTHLETHLKLWTYVIALLKENNTTISQLLWHKAKEKSSAKNTHFHLEHNYISSRKLVWFRSRFMNLQ